MFLFFYFLSIITHIYMYINSTHYTNIYKSFFQRSLGVFLCNISSSLPIIKFTKCKSLKQELTFLSLFFNNSFFSFVRFHNGIDNYCQFDGITMISVLFVYSGRFRYTLYRYNCTEMSENASGATWTPPSVLLSQPNDPRRKSKYNILSRAFFW